MSSFRRSLTGLRFTAPSSSHGIKTEGASTPISFSGSVQPLPAKEMQSLPEGRREKETYRLYTDFELRTVDETTQTNPDQVEINGAMFEVISVALWQNNVIPHYKAIVSKIG